MVEEAPEFLRYPKTPRFYNEDIIITEKLDGSNGQILIWEDSNGLKHIRAGSRSQWLTDKDHNFNFYHFVMENAVELIEGLGVGRHYGEWYGRGINRNYGLTERRFALFNVGRWNAENVPTCCEVVPVIDRGPFGNLSIRRQTVIQDLVHRGSIAVPGFMKPEGFILHFRLISKNYKVILED